MTTGTMDAEAMTSEAPLAATVRHEFDTLDPAGLDLLFRRARTQEGWREDAPVTDDELRALYDLLKWGPTSGNASPARIVFVRSPAAKERLRPALSAGNVDKTMSAPVVAIVATDPHFYDHLPRLWPHDDAKPWFTANRELADETAFRNATLQGAYLILAARALGLDCAPMSGFDPVAVEAAFLADRGWKANFLVCLGHGEPSTVRERAPRLSFDEACVLA